MKILKAFITLFVLLTVVVSQTGALAAEVGERVLYKRGVTFHLELRAVYPSKVVDTIYESRKGGAYPVSYGYPVNTAARDQDYGVRFVDCKDGIRGTVRVEGLKDTASLVGKGLDVLTTGDFKVGTVKTSLVGNDWIEFRDINLTGARTIVIPYLFEQGKKPMAIITPTNWKPVGPFIEGGRYVIDMSHRAFPNGEEKRVNVGMILPMQVKGDMLKGVCDRP